MALWSFLCQSVILSFTVSQVLSSLGVNQAIILKPHHKLVARHKRQTTDVRIPTIKDMYVTSEVFSRYATVVVASKVVNNEDDGLEATFSVQIPQTAFISNFTMVINDSLYIGQVLEKSEAQKKYDEARRQGQSAGQVKQDRRKPVRGMDEFVVNVNVAALSEVSFEMTYQELLDRRLGLYTHRFAVQPQQVVDNLVIDMTYYERQDFSNMKWTLPHSGEILTASSPEHGVTLEASPYRRRILYKPSTSLQGANGLDGLVVVSYDVPHPIDGGTLYSYGNYFAHYFALDKSDEVPVQSKDVMFVIDISGSMSGTKIRQTREAMMSILPQLKPNVDFFNIMLFDDDTEVWNPSGSVLATANNVALAKQYVEDKVKDRGGTNINKAMIDSVKEFKTFGIAADRIEMIVFLTDGQPTTGVTSIPDIRRNIRDLNEGRVSIFSLGFGFGVDYNFLLQVSFENGGFAKFIYEDEDAPSQLESFFDEISYPLFRNCEFIYNPAEVDITTLSQKDYKVFFSGTEVVVVGLKHAPISEVRVKCYTTEQPVELILKPESNIQLSESEGKFTEKLYAYKNIKYILMKMEMAESEQEADRLRAKALRMSLENNFVTPLTSLVIVQEQQNNKMMDEMGTANAGGTNVKTSALSNSLVPSVKIIFITLFFAYMKML